MKRKQMNMASAALFMAVSVALQPFSFFAGNPSHVLAAGGTSSAVTVPAGEEASGENTAAGGNSDNGTGTEAGAGAGDASSSGSQESNNSSEGSAPYENNDEKSGAATGGAAGDKTEEDKDKNKDRDEHKKIKKIRLKVKMTGRKSARFTWNTIKDPEGRSVKYHVLVSRSGRKYSTVKKTLKSSFKIKGFLPGYTYRIKVRAYSGKKSRKNKLRTSDTVRIYIPRFLKGMRVSHVKADIISLSWPHAYKADYYVLYENKGRGYKKVLRTKKTSYTEKIKFNRKYRYKVRAFNKGEDVLTESEFIYGKYIIRSLVKSKGRKYSYREMASDISGLTKRFPGRVSYRIIGYSEDRRAIYDVILGNRGAGKSLLVVASIHAREYMCSLLTMKQIEYYAEEWDKKISGRKVSDILGDTCIHFITMANPDGVSISQYGVNAVRNPSLRSRLKKMLGKKPASLWKADARGVDLNRSFSYLFKKTKKPYGSENCSGKKAEEESETRAIKNCIISLKNSGKLAGVINYHATGSIVFGSLKSGVSSSVAETTTQMYDLAREITGYGSAESYEGDRAGRGNLREYVMYRQNIPSITLEIGKSMCPLPAWEFSSIWRKNRDLVLREAGIL